ncbi:MAG: hypothetical protein RR355_05630, partial [Oscillospiraceae bacterium]
VAFSPKTGTLLSLRDISPNRGCSRGSEKSHPRFLSFLPLPLEEAVDRSRLKEGATKIKVKIKQLSYASSKGKLSTAVDRKEGANQKQAKTKQLRKKLKSQHKTQFNIKATEN